jgi:hypothetical protein
MKLHCRFIIWCGIMALPVTRGFSRNFDDDNEAVRARNVERYRPKVMIRSWSSAMDLLTPYDTDGACLSRSYRQMNPGTISEANEKLGNTVNDYLCPIL